MASVRTYKLPTGEIIEVKGRYREITVKARGEGEGYDLQQFAHIDDSGVAKPRNWGWAPDQVAAVEKAIGHTERQFG
jgi:hypothetical protein